MFQVQKKDGRLEDFDRDKIVRGVLRAGGSNEDAEKIAGEIEAWLPTVAVDNVVQSDNVRTKGLEVLRNLNPTAAADFESYRK